MRNYIVASWNDADQYDYSGEQIGNRQSKSQRVHFNPDGSACVASYADPDVKSKVNIRDRILPQQKRLTTLRAQMLELETSYRNNELSISEYSLYRDIIVAKIQRQEVLYKRAASVKPIRDDEDSYEDAYTQPSYSEQTAYYTEDSTCTNVDSGQRDSSTWLDGISEENTFKSSIKKALHLTRKLVEFKHKVKAYYQTLKEV